MNGKIVIAFLAGLGLGYYFTKRHYEEQMLYYGEPVVEESEEINDEPVEVEQAPWRREKPDIFEYAAKIKEAKYAVDNDVIKEEEGGVESMDSEKPYVISPEEFGEDDEFETESLFYHADGVLTDSRLNVIENVDEIVGIDSLNHFGEYEDDSVFVRNETLHVDYEILKDMRNFADIEVSPHMDED